MFDIHCHILPEFDDGAKDRGVSLSMLESAKRHGVEGIVATSHFSCGDDIEEYLRRRDKRIDALNDLARFLSIPVTVYKGAEVLVNDDIFYAGDLRRLAINEGKYILLEFPFFNMTSNRFFRYINEVKEWELTPIIAHPERYTWLQHDGELLSVIADSGVLFQINADSLFDEGSRESQLAKHLLRHDMASFIASDAHSAGERQHRFYRSKEFVSEEKFHYLTHIAPKRILDGETVKHI